MIIIIFALCFITPPIICAEMAPQFKKGSTNKADLSAKEPKHGAIYKPGNVMERKASSSWGGN